MFHKIFCSDFCWFLKKKICRFKCENSYKIENAFKKANNILSLSSYHNRGEKMVYGLGSDHNRSQKVFKF